MELTGGVEESQEKTYAVLPVDVRPGTTRVEVGYSWADRQPLGGTPITQTVLDLGVYDADGYRSAAGFRGWSGSRQGKLHNDQDPVFIQADSADRGYYPGPIEIGVWHVELGFAAVAPGGADWAVQLRCLSPAVGPTPVSDPVDASHVARNEAGWYHGDFHMHGFHSNPNAPDWDDLVQQARDAQLDFLMFTEYVTGRHWGELGPVQRANPDLVIWPGREIITYFGHANTHGETPGVFEYRHGFEDVNLGDIQRAAKQAGALFQVNHPTTFPGPVFENFCRGCEFTLGSEIDWNLVDTIEVANGPTLVNCTDLNGSCPLPGEIQNPFLTTASRLWEDLIQQGYKIAPISGCDSKGVDAPDERARTG
ncbi:MAG: CehA/McbA family metallohydrolase, partial [Nevskiales bacterium]